MNDCYLAIDLGAESGRVMAGVWDGNRISLEEIHRFANGPVALQDTLRWDLLRLWNEIQTGLTLASKKFGTQIVSIGVDTWGLDYVLLSRSGEMLGQPFCYRDPRTTGLVEEICRQTGRAEIFAGTGLQFMEINTLCQWVAHQRASPEIFAQADCFLMIPDWINWCLTGIKSAEFTNATTTQFFDPVNRAWALDLLRKLGLPTSIFPQLIEPGTRVGTLLNSVRQRTGLHETVSVVAPATHDTGSAVAAVPAEKSATPNWAYISSGTWSLVGVEVPQALLGSRVLDLNFTNEGGVDGTYRLLKNVMGLWLLQQCRSSFSKAGQNYEYAGLVEIARGALPFQSLIDPDDHVFLNPPCMVSAIQQFCADHHEPIPTAHSQIIRCILESLALKYAVVIDWLEELTGTRIETIHVVSGGSKNILLNSFTASACNRPVMAGPVEATALGNILVQMRAHGELQSLAEMRDSVRRSCELEVYEPDSANRSQWRGAAERFRKILQTG